MAARRESRLLGDTDSWPVMSGNVPVISKEFHNLKDVPDSAPLDTGADDYNIMSGNVAVVSKDLWRVRAKMLEKLANAALPGDWTCRKDGSGKAYYYSRKLKRTQWKKPINAAGDTEEAPKTDKEAVDAVDGKPYDWKAAVDEGSGKTYYYSRLRNKTQWKKPAKASSVNDEDDWVEKQDKKSGKKYYFSPSRNVTVWRKPAGSKAGSSSSSSSKPGTGAGAGAGAGAGVPGGSGGGAAETATDWVAKVDAASGRTYYASKSLRKTTWQKPANFVDSSTAAPPKPAAAAPPPQPGQPAPPATEPVPPTVPAPPGAVDALVKSLVSAGSARSLPVVPAPDGSRPATPPPPEQDVDASLLANVQPPTAVGAPTEPPPGSPIIAAQPPPTPGGGAGGSNRSLTAPPSFRWDPTDPGDIEDAPPEPDAAPELPVDTEEEAAQQFDLEGYLMKKGGGSRLFGRKNWKKRYFVLDSCMLTYFDNQDAYENNQEPLKGEWISVMKYELEEFVDSLDFNLRPIAGEDVERDRVFHLRALCEEDKDQWMDAIRAAAEYDRQLQK